MNIAVESDDRVPMRGSMLLFTVIGAAFGAASLAGLVQIGGAGAELLQGVVGAILGGAIGYRLCSS